jgi:hypothetical protein
MSFSSLACNTNAIRIIVKYIPVMMEEITRHTYQGIELLPLNTSYTESAVSKIHHFSDLTISPVRYWIIGSACHLLPELVIQSFT